MELETIPKLVVIDAESSVVLADWGPRPEPAKKIIQDYKATHGVVDETTKIELQNGTFKTKVFPSKMKS